MSWELVTAAVASAFLWGLARGTAVCLTVCVPGMLPYIAERPGGGVRRGLSFAMMLCAPRFAIFAVLGLVWGAASYAIFQTEAFESTSEWLYFGGYLVLGAVITVAGMALFLKAAKDKDRLAKAKRTASEGGVPVPPPEEPHHGSLSRALLRLIPASRRGERAFVLLWGAILGVACLLEVSIIELGVLGTLSGSVASATAVAAALGAAVMVAFAAGASVPIMLAAAGFAAYVDTVSNEERLISLRVTGSLMMVVIGGMLVLRYGAMVLSLL